MAGISQAESAEDFEEVGAEDAMKIRLAGLRKLAEDLAEVFRLREKGEAELYYKASSKPLSRPGLC